MASEQTDILTGINSASSDIANFMLRHFDGNRNGVPELADSQIDALNEAWGVLQDIQEKLD